MPLPRPLRRFAAVISALALVPVAMTGARGACPLGGAMAPMTTATMAVSHAIAAEQPSTLERSTGHHQSVATDVGAPSLPHHAPGGRAHCDMSCAPASCGATGHCLTTIAGESVATANLDITSGRVVSAFADGEPRSVRAGPEPPPPRA